MLHLKSKSNEHNCYHDMILLDLSIRIIYQEKKNQQNTICILVWTVERTSNENHRCAFLQYTYIMLVIKHKTKI